jgi:hypothetical protein
MIHGIANCLKCAEKHVVRCVALGLLLLSCRAALGAEKPSPLTRGAARSGASSFDIVPGIGDEELSGGQFSDEALAHLRSAQVCIQFGIAGHGNVESFAAAEESLALAEKVVRSSKAGAPVALSVIETMRSHCLALQSHARQTLFGRFPLIREFGVDTESTDSDERVKSFSVAGAAEQAAIHAALSRAVKSAGSSPLSVVVGVPGAATKDADDCRFAELATSEARTLFAKFPAAKWFPVDWATSEQGLPEWDAPDPAFDPICRKVLKREPKGRLARSVMIVFLREWGGPQEGDYWVQAQQRLFEPAALEKAEDKPSKLEADKVVLSESLAHDRSGYTPMVLLGALALLFLAIVLHGREVARLSALSANWYQRLLVPVFGFGIGIGLPALIVAALERALPEPTSNALTSAWWPFVAGGLSLVLPAGVFRLLAGSGGRYVPAASCQGHWGISFVPVALGVAAAWLHPMWSALGWEGTLPIIPLTLAAVGIAYVFGRAIDTVDEYPTVVVPLALIWAGLFGLGAFMGAAWLLTLVAAGSLATLVLPGSLQRKADTLFAESSATQLTGSGQRPKNLVELAAAIQAPLYQPPTEFARLQKAVGPLENEKICWLGISGPSAAGKTAAIIQLAHELRGKYRGAKILSGTCHEEPQPYQVFHDALAELGIAAGLASSQSHGGEVNTVIEKLADEFIPLWSYISDYESAGEGTEGVRGDLPVLVVGTLLKLAQVQPVVLCLDGAQWMDESSVAILQHLREHLPPGHDGAIAILVASRDPGTIERLSLGDAAVELPLPDQRAQMNILQTSLGIETQSAARLVEALGLMGQEPGGLSWLFRSVQTLVEEKAFQVTANGYRLEEKYMLGDRLPVPSSLRAKLAEAMKATGADRELLECAALLGERFRVDDVADVLKRDRLDVLRVLQRLEQEFKLVRDVPNHADRYAFSSSFLHRVVRDSLETPSPLNGGHATPSKIAAEIHARIAKMYEAREQKDSPATYAIARHYAQAGPKYARETLDYGLQAASVALKLGALGDARHFISLAETPARHFGEMVPWQAMKEQIANAEEVSTVRKR